VGAIGAQGNAPTGSQGPQGPKGFIGPAGNSPIGAQGPQGAVGNSPVGPAGFQGKQGSRGNQGPTGFPGATGPQGGTGPTGPPGSQGPQGFQGNVGATGPQGAQGAQGNQGPTGPPSDKRLKTDIIQIDEAIQKISKIRGVTYKRVWRNADNEIVRISPNKDYGFVAQEIEVVIPEAVIVEKKNNFRLVKYAELVSISIQAINEQKIILDESERKLEYLENKVKERGLI
jgi:hypothetical protein